MAARAFLDDDGSSSTDAAEEGVEQPGGVTILPPTPAQLAAAEHAEREIIAIRNATNEVLRRVGDHAYGFPPGLANELSATIERARLACDRCEHSLRQCNARAVAATARYTGDVDVIQRGTEAVRTFRQVALGAQQVMGQMRAPRAPKHADGAPRGPWTDLFTMTSEATPPPARAPRQASPSSPSPPPRPSPLEADGRHAAWVSVADSAETPGAEPPRVLAWWELLGAGGEATPQHTDASPRSIAAQPSTHGIDRSSSPSMAGARRRGRGARPARDAAARADCSRPGYHRQERVGLLDASGAAGAAPMPPPRAPPCPRADDSTFMHHAETQC
jgi:hypothetical protein